MNVQPVDGFFEVPGPATPAPQLRLKRRNRFFGRSVQVVLLDAPGVDRSVPISIVLACVAYTIFRNVVGYVHCPRLCRAPATGFPNSRGVDNAGRIDNDLLWVGIGWIVLTLSDQNRSASSPPLRSNHPASSVSHFTKYLEVRHNNGNNGRELRPGDDAAVGNHLRLV